jgi:hypothetical protein
MIILQIIIIIIFLINNKLSFYFIIIILIIIIILHVILGSRRFHCVELHIAPSTATPALQHYVYEHMGDFGDDDVIGGTRTCRFASTIEKAEAVYDRVISDLVS